MGLGVDDGVPINPVLFSVFILLGVIPTTYAALMIPSARSNNKVRMLLRHRSSLAPEITTFQSCFWHYGACISSTGA